MEKIIKPSYLKDFNCIGGACEDTCCAGWYIAVDENTYKKYKKVNDPAMKIRLNKELVEKKNGTADHKAKIKLKNGRCAFLNKEGWCDIYTGLGEQYLSDTCTLYPRAINKINDNLEYTLIMSCPEAARKILLNKESMQFEVCEETASRITISANVEVCSDDAVKWQDYFLEIRTLLIHILQDRSKDFETRLQGVGEVLKQLEPLAQKRETKKIKSLLEKIQEDLKGSVGNENIEKEAIVAAKLAVYLRYLDHEKKLHSSRYRECLKEVLEGLQVKDELVIDEVYSAYTDGYKTHYKSFLEEKGFILENYFTNYVFERCIPVDASSPMESFSKLQLYYRLLRLQLIGLANNHKSLNDETIVKLIQSFTKTFDHNSESMEAIIEYTAYNC
ncbi:MAG: flagellin lysine-N-methylase [Cellulosilyticaceae bacterium]